MMCRSFGKCNISGLLVLALKYTSVSFTSCNEIKSGKISHHIRNHGDFKKNNSSFNNSVNGHSSVADLHKEWSSHFETSGVPDPESSIRLIIEHVLGISKAYEYELNQKVKVTADEEKQIRTLCECRLARMPVQYIIKEWDFRDLRLTMCPPVFIPRPETEQLVDLVVETVPDNAVALEVGCGSGAICLSLCKALPNAQVVAIDQSKLACQLTISNAQLNGLTSNLQVIHSKLQEDGNLTQPLLVDQVDVLVSNPPYIPSAQIFHLQPEIKLYEDLRALEAGQDGLRVVRALLLLAQTLLKSGGLIFLEVDSSHPKLIEKWLTDHPEMKIKFVNTFKDFCDRERFVELKKL